MSLVVYSLLTGTGCQWITLSSSPGITFRFQGKPLHKTHSTSSVSGAPLISLVQISAPEVHLPKECWDFLVLSPGAWSNLLVLYRRACSSRHPTLHGIACQKPEPMANPGSQIACTRQNSHYQEGPWAKGACWLMWHPDL